MRKHTLYLVLALGLVLAPSLSLAKTIDANDLLTTTVKAKHTIRWANKTVFTKFVKFKKSVRVLGTLTTKDLHVTGETTLDNPLTPDQLGPVTDDASVQTGLVEYKIIEGAALTALLDGNANTAFTLNENDIVIDTLVVVETKATSGTLDVGVDENWSNLSAAGDGLLNDVDLLTNGVNRNATSDEANQGTLAGGAAVVSATGDVTIQSSADLTADTEFTGKLIITYLNL